MSMTGLGWFLLLLVLIAFIILSIVVANIFPGYGLEVLYLTSAIGVSWILIKVFRSKNQYGLVLLGVLNDFRFVLIILTPINIFVLGGTVWRDAFVFKQHWLVTTTGLLAFILFIILAIYIFFAKLEIREKAIIHPYSNIKWEDIESYSWKGAQIVLRLKKPKILKKWELAVPSKQKEAVNKLLSERLRYIEE